MAGVTVEELPVADVKEKPVASPCISVCALDENDICEGCFRSSREITDWREYSNDEKCAVVQVAQQRMKSRFNLG